MGSHLRAGEDASGHPSGHKDRGWTGGAKRIQQIGNIRSEMASPAQVDKQDIGLRQELGEAWNLETERFEVEGRRNATSACLAEHVERGRSVACDDMQEPKPVEGAWFKALVDPTRRGDRKLQERRVPVAADQRDRMEGGFVDALDPAGVDAAPG
ncbi:MAG: hypothetical protein WKF78_01695 [Candidatus Limnocylindrales bacterium]